MPLFNYKLTYATESKSVELRKSNPQGWLPEAVMAAFPEMATRRREDVLRLRLEKVTGLKQTWQTTLKDGSDELLVYVTQTSPKVRK
jgi:hypothetical protein